MNPALVYFCKPVGMDGPIKIGCSDSPLDRLKMLMVWCPFKLELLATAPGSYEIERKLHDRCWAFHSHCEWFMPHPDLLEGIASLNSGASLDEAFGLATVMKVKRQSTRTPWSPAERHRISTKARIRWAVSKASSSTGNRLFMPPDLEPIEQKIDRCLDLAPFELARLEQVIADPLNHCVPYNVRYPKPQPRPDPSSGGERGMIDPFIPSVLIAQAALLIFAAGWAIGRSR